MSTLGDLLTRPMADDDLLATVLARKKVTYNRTRDTVRLIAQRFPDFVDRTIAHAERALTGHLVLPGTGLKPMKVGDPPQWAKNPTEDEEFITHLNRMGHWRVLCLAYALGQEERYAEKVLCEMDDWIERCPVPKFEKKAFEGHHAWRCLEAGIRMVETWPGILDFLLTSPAMTGERFARYVQALHDHGRVLAAIPAKFHPDADHHHYLMQMLGLLAVGCNLPELADAEGWREQARHELERCAQVQLTPEGGQIEGCPAHHNGCATWFLLSFLIGRKRGVHFSPDYHERVENMLSYTLHVLRPNGTVVPWGDSDPDPHQAATAALYGWLALHRDAPLRLVSSLVGPRVLRDTVLLHLRHVEDVQGVLAMLGQGLQPHEHLPLWSWQKELKQVAMRTGWGRNDLSVFFACRTPVHDGHAHIDPMGFDLSALGKPLVVDPGRFTWRECKDRQLFKSAAVHNTLTIDGKDPFAYKSSFAFKPQGKGLIRRVEDRPGHDRRYSIDGSKLRSLGWRPKMQWEEGVRRTVRWYAENESWWRPLKSGEFMEYYRRQYGKRLGL